METYKQLIVITGASGRVGGRLAQNLLRKNFRVRAVSRDIAKLKHLKDAGAELIQSALNDVETLSNAFQDAHAVFLLTPLNLHSENLNDEQRKNIAGMIQAISNSGVKNIVLLSSWGAELTSNSGGILGCHIFEKELDKIGGLNCLIMRPVWFMENFLYNIELIKMSGINGFAIAPEKRFPMVAAADIADFAATSLAEKIATGKQVIYLKCSLEYSMREVTSVLGKAVGKSDLAYLEFPQKVLKQGLTGSGALSPDAADMFMEINAAISKGVVAVPEGAFVHYTPTTLDEFAKNQFAPAYDKSAKPSLLRRASGVSLRLFLLFAGQGLLRKQEAAV